LKKKSISFARKVLMYRQDRVFPNKNVLETYAGGKRGRERERRQREREREKGRGCSRMQS
jgi:hypothetical protein